MKTVMLFAALMVAPLVPLSMHLTGTGGCGVCDCCECCTTGDCSCGAECTCACCNEGCPGGGPRGQEKVRGGSDCCVKHAS
jgi:hypothetical protein